LAQDKDVVSRMDEACHVEMRYMQYMQEEEREAKLTRERETKIYGRERKGQRL